MGQVHGAQAEALLGSNHHHHRHHRYHETDVACSESVIRTVRRIQPREKFLHMKPHERRTPPPPQFMSCLLRRGGSHRRMPEIVTFGTEACSKPIVEKSLVFSVSTAMQHRPEYSRVHAGKSSES